MISKNLNVMKSSSCKEVVLTWDSVNPFFMLTYRKVKCFLYSAFLLSLHFPETKTLLRLKYQVTVQVIFADVLDFFLIHFWKSFCIALHWAINGFLFQGFFFFFFRMQWLLGFLKIMDGLFRKKAIPTPSNRFPLD